MTHAVLVAASVAAAITLVPASAASQVPASQAPPAAQSVALPPAAGPGQPRESRVLLEAAGIKLSAITLRRGTVLPDHRAPVSVTIQALHGAGTVIAGTVRLRLDAAHAVVLAPNTSHSIEPDAGTDLVLLVHHLGTAEEGHP